MVSALSVTLNMPNIGLIIYYLVCVIIIPIVLINTKNIDMLPLYFPLLLPLATILKTSGNPNMYQNLLMCDKSKTLVAMVSNTIILLLTIVGIFWYSINLSLDSGKLADGILIGMSICIVIFGSSYVLLPESIKKFDNFMKTKTDMDLTYEWHRYVIGFIVLMIIVGFELSIFSLFNVKKNIRNEVQF